MGISKRLQTVADAVTPGNRVADIGTDHGYVPITLVKNKISPAAIAADINKGPLERARKNIREDHLSGKIAVRLGSGLTPLAPEETDTVVIAGMGGDLICRILQESPEFLAAGKEFILQPQSEWFKVRRLLIRSGYAICNEWFLKEEGKYYLILKAVPAAQAAPFNEAPSCEPGSREAELYEQYGSCLIKEKNPVYKEYLEKEIEKKKTIAGNLQAKAAAGQSRERCEALQQEISDIEEILKKMLLI